MLKRDRQRGGGGGGGRRRGTTVQTRREAIGRCWQKDSSKIGEHSAKGGSTSIEERVGGKIYERGHNHEESGAFRRRSQM